jgi:hypothetical protein
MNRLILYHNAHRAAWCRGLGYPSGKSLSQDFQLHHVYIQGLKVLLYGNGGSLSWSRTIPGVNVLFGVIGNPHTHQAKRPFHLW